MLGLALQTYARIQNRSSFEWGWYGVYFWFTGRGLPVRALR